MIKLLACAAVLASAVPVLADSAVHPLVDAQSGYLLGGSKNGKWLSDKETAKLLKGGESYSVYGQSTKLGQTTGSKSRNHEAPCDETEWVRLKKNYNGVLAVGGTWNAQPRKVRVQNTTQTYYRGEVRRILQQNGIKKPNVVITQLWRVDLDGDGEDEVLLSASNYSGQKALPMHVSPNAKAGEYSLVLLRKVVGGRVRTIILASEYHVKDETFSAPSVHVLSGVFDGNGDGRMEVLVNSRYYEGESVALVDINGSSLKSVATSGCGA